MGVFAVAQLPARSRLISIRSGNVHRCSKRRICACRAMRRWQRRTRGAQRLVGRAAHGLPQRRPHHAVLEHDGSRADRSRSPRRHGSPRSGANHRRSPLDVDELDRRVGRERCRGCRRRDRSARSPELRNLGEVPRFERSARIPPWTLDVSVFTRPSRAFLGEPVTSATSRWAIGMLRRGFGWWVCTSEETISISTARKPLPRQLDDACLVIDREQSPHANVPFLVRGRLSAARMVARVELAFHQS